jgi:hypothetical protein
VAGCRAATTADFGFVRLPNDEFDMPNAGGEKESVE